MNPFTSVWDYVTGFDAENAQRAAEADAKIRAINESRISDGTFDAQQAAQIKKNFEMQEAFGVGAQRDEINQAFSEGLDEGADNVTGFVRGMFNVVGKALSSVLLGVPAWVWLLAAAGVFLWLGGGAWLLRKSKGALA